MSRFRVERLLLGCAADSAVLLALPAAAKSAVETLAALDFDPAQPASLAALCGALSALAPAQPIADAARLPLVVTLDDSLARSFVVTPPRGARGLRELRASAAARFAALYGESAEPWLLAADWQAAAPFVSCALPRELYQALEGLARTQGWRLDSATPALVRVWNRVCPAIPADGWLGIGFARTLTLVHHQHGELAGLRTLRLPAAPDLAELETLLEQERLRNAVATGMQAGQSLLWTGGAKWLPAAATVAGITSRTLPLPCPKGSPGERPVAEQLALAGGPR